MKYERYRNVSPQRQGSSWLQILLLLSIIAIAVFLLMPVNIICRMNSKQSVCQSNLKQFSQALFQYTVNADGIYPTRYLSGMPEADNPLVNPSRPGWIINPLKSYIKGVDLAQCPGKLPNRHVLYPVEWETDIKGHPLRAKDTYYSTYAYNYARFTGLDLKKMDDPTQAALMWESVNNYFDEISNVGWSRSSFSMSRQANVDQEAAMRSMLSPNGDLYYYCSKPNVSCAYKPFPTTSQPKPNYVMWHNDKSNVVWADGHVSMTSFNTLKWNQLLNMAKTDPCYDRPMTQCHPLISH